MIRALFRLIVVVVLLVGAAAFFFGYRWGDGDDAPADAVGTAGQPAPVVDTDRAREAGAEVGEKVATGTAQAQRALSDGSLTTKIKAKMALDDTVRAAAIDVDTDGTVVTLSGRVGSDAERTKAVQLARETEGVTSVVDRLVVQ